MTISFKKNNFMDNKWEVDTSQTNHFKYAEETYAVHVNFSSQIKKIRYSAGLRLENTRSKSISTTTNNSYTNNYTKLFPDVSIQYEFTDNGDKYLILSYNKRITRPPYVILNPFSYLLDQYTIKKGNPYLKPAIEQSVGLVYSINKNLSASVNYSFTRKAISDVNLNNGNYNIETFSNLSSAQTWYSNLAYSAELTKWWNTTSDISYIYNFYKDPYFRRDYSGVSISTNNNITITSKLSFQFNYSFTTKGYDRYYKNNLNQAILNTTLQYKFFNNSMLVRIGANDIFYRQGYLDSYMDYQGQQINTIIKIDTRMFSLSIRYMFKKGLNKEIKELNKSNSDEMRRIN